MRERLLTTNYGINNQCLFSSANTNTLKPLSDTTWQSHRCISNGFCGATTVLAASSKAYAQCILYARQPIETRQPGGHGRQYGQEADLVSEFPELCDTS